MLVLRLVWWLRGSTHFAASVVRLPGASTPLSFPAFGLVPAAPPASGPGGAAQPIPDCGYKAMQPGVAPVAGGAVAF